MQQPERHTGKDRLLSQNIGMNPTRVELELTEACNLKCSFCYNSQRPIVSSSVDEILGSLEEEDVLEIVLTGGEPMLHPSFRGILSHCAQRFSKVMVQTNGTCIDRDYARYFREQGVFGVNVSLHGSESVHENLTGVPGSFAQARNAIRFLLDNNIRTASNFVITSANKNDLYAHITSLYELGLHEVTLTRFTPTGIGVGNTSLALAKSDLNAALRCAKQCMAQYSDLRVILANAMPYCALDEDLKEFCSYCHFGISRFYIDVNGNVLMCGMSRIRIGNILEMSFREMKKMSALYQEYVCGRCAPSQCKACQHFSTCRGGCRAAAYASTGTFYGQDPLSAV